MHVTDRPMPPDPDRYASCPFDQGVLDYYSGTFDAVYVTLSPFLEPVLVPRSAFFLETAAESYFQSRDTCEPVPWSEVIARSNLSSLNDVDIALRTAIGGLNPGFADQALASELERTLESEGWVEPIEGRHSAFLHRPVLAMFKELGHDYVWIGDEFCTERKLHCIDDLINDDPLPHFRPNIFSPDESLLWTVHWDSHFSFLAASGKRLRELDVSKKLEGFFCTPETEVFWSLQDRVG